MTSNVVNLAGQRRVARAIALMQAGGGGNDDGMPPSLTARVDPLERDVAEIKGDVKTVSGDVRHLAIDTAEIKGRVLSMPTTFQVTTWFVGVSIGLVGLVFAIAKLVR